MRKLISLIVLCTMTFGCVKAAHLRVDTCIYIMSDNNCIDNLTKIVSVNDIIEENRNKAFYLAEINLLPGENRMPKVTIKECSSIGEDKVVLFNDTVINLNFKFSSISVDPSLFTYIRDTTTAAFGVEGCAGSNGIHSGPRFLVMKLNNKYLIGSSLDGSYLTPSLKTIANRYFIFNSSETRHKFLNVINSLDDKRSL